MPHSYPGDSALEGRGGGSEADLCVCSATVSKLNALTLRASSWSSPPEAIPCSACGLHVPLAFVYCKLEYASRFDPYLQSHVTMEGNCHNNNSANSFRCRWRTTVSCRFLPWSRETGLPFCSLSDILAQGPGAGVHLAPVW